jgi:hypothetical protein
MNSDKLLFFDLVLLNHFKFEVTYRVITYYEK